jgi:hypothetical protein
MLGDIQAVYVATFAVSIGGVKAALNRAERCYLNDLNKIFGLIICGSGLEVSASVMDDTRVSLPSGDYTGQGK